MILTFLILQYVNDQHVKNYSPFDDNHNALHLVLIHCRDVEILNPHHHHAYPCCHQRLPTPWHCIQCAILVCLRPMVTTIPVHLVYLFSIIQNHVRVFLKTVRRPLLKHLHLRLKVWNHRHLRRVVLICGNSGHRL